MCIFWGHIGNTKCGKINNRLWYWQVSFAFVQWTEYADNWLDGFDCLHGPITLTTGVRPSVSPFTFKNTTLLVCGVMCIRRTDRVLLTCEWDCFFSSLFPPYIVACFMICLQSLAGTLKKLYQICHKLGGKKWRKALFINFNLLLKIHFSMALPKTETNLTIRHLTKVICAYCFGMICPKNLASYQLRPPHTLRVCKC